MKNRLAFIPAFVIVLTLFIVGTFLDLEISKGIANTYSSWPNFFAGFASLPLCLVISFISGNLIKIITEGRYSKVYQNILIGLYALVCFLFSAFLFGHTMTSYHAFGLYGLDIKFLIPIGLIVAIIGGVLGYRFFKLVDNKNYIKLSLYLLITCTVAFCIVYGFKLIAPRARYTSIIKMTSGETYYRPWYNPSITQDIIDKLTKLGKEEAQSFPSGHSSCAILMVIILSNLPLFIKKLRGKEVLLFYIGFIYYIFIGFSRLYKGAHYLTDITFAGLVGLMVYFVSNEIYLIKIKGGLK